MIDLNGTNIPSWIQWNLKVGNRKNDDLEFNYHCFVSVEDDNRQIRVYELASVSWKLFKPISNKTQRVSHFYSSWNNVYSSYVRHPANDDLDNKLQLERQPATQPRKTSWHMIVFSLLMVVVFPTFQIMCWVASGVTLTVHEYWQIVFLCENLTPIPPHKQLKWLTFFLPTTSWLLLLQTICAHNHLFHFPKQLHQNSED